MVEDPAFNNDPYKTKCKQAKEKLKKSASHFISSIMYGAPQGTWAEKKLRQTFAKSRKGLS